MLPDILILGQGLAGTLLGLELERGGLDFAVVDPGHRSAASAVAAGIVNPITGRRIVPTWRAAELVPEARDFYRTIEDRLRINVWSDMRIWRTYSDERERATARAKGESGALAPFVETVEDTGFWIHGAGRVDLPGLLAAARQHWRATDRLHDMELSVTEALERAALVIDCRGQGTADDPRFAFVPWEFSKGEVLEIAVTGLDPDVIINCRHWIAPVGPDRARVGATQVPGRHDVAPTSAGREELEGFAREALEPGQAFSVTGHRAGLRVHVSDKRPVAGRHPAEPRLGVVNALGGKGALWGPFCARLWYDHLQRERAFDPGVDVGRFT